MSQKVSFTGQAVKIQQMKTGKKPAEGIECAPPGVTRVKLKRVLASAVHKVSVN